MSKKEEKEFARRVWRHPYLKKSRVRFYGAIALFGQAGVERFLYEDTSIAPVISLIFGTLLLQQFLVRQELVSLQLYMEEEKMKKHAPAPITGRWA